MKRPRRVLVLMHEDLVPPSSLDGVEDVQAEPWKTEYDVCAALAELGHDVRKLGLGSDLRVLRDAIDEFRPHINFNLMEEFHGVGVYDQHVVSYLELLKRRYTGCNPRGLMLAHDKALSKQVLHYHRIAVPDFAVFPMGRRTRRPRRLEFPLIVKSLTEEGSLGISQASLVNDDKQLAERVEFIHRQVSTDAIAERFIAGRELYMGLLGNQRIHPFPIWELRQTKARADEPLIATSKLKWDSEYQKRKGVVWERAKGLGEALEQKIVKLCKRTSRILNLTGYSRIDMRLSEDGRIWVLEANPNPDLAFGAEFADSAESDGVEYPELVQRILRLGLRYRAQWQQ